jgi:hypothetical protein
MTVATAKKSVEHFGAIDVVWKKPVGVSKNAIFNAYMQGRIDGRSEVDTERKKQFFENLTKAQKIGVGLYNDIKTNLNIKPYRIYLRPDSMISFDFLLVFDLSDYISSKLFEAYEVMRKIKFQVSDDKFRIFCQSMPMTENLEESCLVADGYYFYYEEKSS